MKKLFLISFFTFSFSFSYGQSWMWGTEEYFDASYTASVATDRNGNTFTTPEAITAFLERWNATSTITVTTSGDTTFCSGSIATLCANPTGGSTPYTYTWQPGNLQTQCVTVSPIVTTTYSASVTDNSGATASATALIQVVPAPVVSFSADTTEGCPILCVEFSNNSTISSGGIFGYYWNFGDGNNSSSSNVTHCYSASGVYNVSLIAEADNGCESTLTKANYITVNTCTGINSITNETANITAYPNPSNGIFTIQSSLRGTKQSLQIYNVLGKEVFSQLSIVNYPLSIDLSAQPSGVYFYRVISEDGALIGEGKIIIQK